MFGFSLAELAIVFLVAILVIKPKDLPAIAYFLGKIYYKIKNVFNEAKSYMAKAEKELGLEEIRKEFNRAQISQEIESSTKKTKIVDIYGNIHEVENVDAIRSDLTQEEIEKEVAKYNQNNEENKITKKPKMAKKKKPALEKSEILKKPKARAKPKALKMREKTSNSANRKPARKKT